MKLLRSLDLFSGAGGLTLALEGICKPVAYCEINPVAQAVLLGRMADGSLPKAPLHPDVTKLKAADLKGGVDVIVGGWPCQDLSILGLRKGMGTGTRSGLISEVYRLVDELRPKALFLENVPEALNKGFVAMKKAFVAVRGYEMRWAIVPASAVGAPHIRKRFFCLLTSPGFHRTFRVDYAPKTWRSEPPRMKLDNTQLTARAFLMGNSVVPDCARAAFVTLASAFAKHPSRKLLKEKTVSIDVMDPDAARLVADVPNWGMARRDGKGGTSVYEVPVPRLLRPALDLTIDRATFKASRSKIINTRGFESPLLKHPRHMTAWGTPRSAMSRASRILTVRTRHDLPTQVRFEVHTPDELRGGFTNPEFLEWMMGYKRGWTEV
jgi:DNA (cytosine-5)-methyltransferase 1